MDIASLLAPVEEQTTLRNGSWSWIEERYTLALIDAFLQGAFPSLPQDTTLRGFIATQLQCVPMRVSKKLASGSLAGKPVVKKLGKSRYFRDETLDMTLQQNVLNRLSLLEAAFLQDLKKEKHTARSVSRPSSPNHAGNRAGHWPLKEEIYVHNLINCFLNGYLDLCPGTTLRSFLADRLNCSPMRISKKLGTGMLLGRSVPRRLGSTVYVPNRAPSMNFHHIAQEARVQLNSLHYICFEC